MKKISLLLILACLISNPNQTFAHEFTKSSEAIPEKNQERYFVGELGERWQFPSDHLPRGATINNFHIASWNILKREYLHHIQSNSQGLRDSAIMKDNVPFEPLKPITVREVKTVYMVLEMLTHPTHPRSLIALEETHSDIQDLFRELVPDRWVIVTPPDQPNSQDIFIYDTQVFDFVSVEAVKYSPVYPKTIFTLNLQEKATGQYFRFIQSHIPGGPKNGPEGCAKFAKEAIRQFDESITTVLMGDMNQSAEVIDKALAVAAQEAGLPFSPYWNIFINHPSHIDTNMNAAWIDHFFVYATSTPEAFDVIHGTQNPKNLCEAIVPVVKLLKSLRDNIGDQNETH